MDELNNAVETESVETPEVAEPVAESVETPEVAEPVKSEADAAFAQMRRENEALRRQAKELDETLGLFFSGDDKIAQAKAHYYEKDVDEVKAEMQSDAEKEYLKNRVAELEAQQKDIYVKNAMEHDLTEIQKLDPKVKSLDELGETYSTLIANGVDWETAYYAAVAHKERHSVSAPKPTGKLDNSIVEKDHFTREEVEQMSDAEVHKNYDKIKKSMAKW